MHTAEIQTLERDLEVRVGLAFTAPVQAKLSQAVRILAARRGISVDAVCRDAVTNSALRSELIAQLTVSESFFFRQPEHFEALREHVAAVVRDGGNDRVAVWSAGCATGEEIYSVALTLVRRFGLAFLRSTFLLGTDVSEDAVARARTGVYSRWSLRGLDESALGPYMIPGEGGTFAIAESIRSAVSFEHGPLQQSQAMAAVGRFHVVFFRNVALYLKPDATAHLYAGVARALTDGGLLLTGPADPSPPSELFDAIGERGRGCFVRRHRPGLRSQAAPLRPTSTGTVNAAAAVNGTWSPDMAPNLTLRDGGEKAPHFAGSSHEPGRGGQALGRDRRCIQTAQEQIAAGAAADAVVELRRILFVDPCDVVARFWFACALQASGKRDLARRQLVAVSEALATERPDTQVGADVDVALLSERVRDLMETLK